VKQEPPGRLALAKLRTPIVRRRYRQPLHAPLEDRVIGRDEVVQVIEPLVTSAWRLCARWSDRTKMCPAGRPGAMALGRYFDSSAKSNSLRPRRTSAVRVDSALYRAGIRGPLKDRVLSSSSVAGG
jgi:transposase